MTSSKTWLKRLIGSALSIDLCEKLTEYSIWRRRFPLESVPVVNKPRREWDEAELRETVWAEALARLGDAAVLYLEFGVWKGRSIAYFAQNLKSADSRLIGFDSFDGLPEDWRGMKKGHFGVGGRTPAIADARVTFVRGWFQDSLPGVIDRIADAAKGRTVLVHFDADLYSSTLYLLFALSARLSSFHFLFDEFSGHESRALHNFLQASGAEAEFFAQSTWRGMPGVVFGRLAGRKS